MKKLLLFLFVVSLICFSCNLFKKKSEPIYIKTISSIGNIRIANNMKTTSKITVVNTDNFEIGLYLQANKTDYLGQETLEESNAPENFRYVFLVITDVKGNNIHFKTSTELLAFMLKHGYEMKDNKKIDAYTEYTFKKT